MSTRDEHANRVREWLDYAEAHERKRRCVHGVALDYQDCWDCLELARRRNRPHYRWSYSAGVWVLQGRHRLAPPEVYPSNLRPASGMKRYLTSSRDLWKVL
jgi:hypothetical protein